jgi:hypothetical protein
MKVKHINVKHIKAISDFTLDVGQRGAKVMAMNGTGKTTLLQLIEFASGEEPGLLGEKVTSLGKDQGEAQITFVNAAGKEYVSEVVFASGSGRPKKVSLRSMADGGNFASKKERAALFRRKSKGFFNITDFVNNQSTVAGRSKNWKRYFEHMSKMDIDELRTRLKESSEMVTKCNAAIKEANAVIKAAGLTGDMLMNIPDPVDVRELEAKREAAYAAKREADQYEGELSQAAQALIQAQKAVQEYHHEIDAAKEAEITRLMARIEALNTMTAAPEGYDFRQKERLADNAKSAAQALLKVEKSPPNMSARLTDEELEQINIEIQGAADRNARIKVAEEIAPKYGQMIKATQKLEEARLNKKDAIDEINSEAERLGSELFPHPSPYKMVADEEDGTVRLCLETEEGLLTMEPTQVQASHLVMAGAVAGMNLLKKSSDIRVITIPDASLLDSSMQAKLIAEAEKLGFQLFMEIVSDTEEIQIEEL